MIIITNSPYYKHIYKNFEKIIIFHYLLLFNNCFYFEKELIILISLPSNQRHAKEKFAFPYVLIHI